MSGKLENWSELLEQRSQTLFVARKRERTIFRRNFAYDLPEYLLFAIHGPTGVGKSALMTYYQSIATEHGALVAQADGNQATAVYEQTVLQTMAAIAQCFANADTPLTAFDKHYTHYITNLETINQDPDAPGNVFALWQNYADTEEENAKAQDQALAWNTYLTEKFGDESQTDSSPAVNKITLIKRPVKSLTYFFIQDLNKLAEGEANQRVLLCFDDWEHTERHLDNWLRGILLEGKLNINIWVVIASQVPLKEPWTLFHPIMTTLTLQPFTEKETITCLEAQHLKDTRRHADIVTFSEGLPILVRMLASATAGQAGDLALSAVDRYLKWLETPLRRETALQCAAARFLNVEVFSIVTETDDEALFRWLIEGPLVIRRPGDWVYHPALRPRLLEFAQGHYLQENRKTHQRLKGYYEALLASYADMAALPVEETPGETPAFYYHDKHWQHLKLEALYHGLMLGDNETLYEGIHTFLVALHTYYPLAGEILMTWQQVTQESTRASISTNNLLKEWANTLELGWRAFEHVNAEVSHPLENHDWDAVLKFCDIVLQRQYDLTPLAREEIQALHELAQERQAIQVQQASGTPDVQRQPPSSPDPDEAERPPEASARLGQETIDERVEETALAAPQAQAEEKEETEEHPIPEEDFDQDPSSDQIHQELSSDQTQEISPSQTQETSQDQSQAVPSPQTQVPSAAQETEKTPAIPPPPDSSSPTEKEPPTEETETTTEIKLPHGNYANWMEYMRAEGQEKAETSPPAEVPQPADISQPVDEETARQSTDGQLPYTSWEEVEQAIDEYTRKFDPNPAYAVAYNNRANAYFDLGEIEKAIQEYSKAIEINPQYAVAYNNRGLAHAQLQHYQKAIEDYDQALAIHPHYATAYNNRGLAYAHQGNYTRALDDYDQAIVHNPDDASAYNNRANTYYNLKKYPEAIEDYNQAITLNSTYTAAYINRGLAYTHLQDYERALESYKEALKLDPDNDTLHSHCGFAYVRLQQYKRALEAYAQAIAINPQNANAYNQRGLVHAKLGDYTQAIAEYEKAVAINAQYATAYYNAACAAALLSDEEQACTWLEKAIDLDEKYVKMAQGDRDFEAICNAPEFQTLIES